MVETPYAPALLLELFLKCVILNCVLKDFVYAVLKKWMIFIDLDILSFLAFCQLVCSKAFHILANMTR